MGLKVRRVVTGRDANGRAVIIKDLVAENIVRKRPGYESCVIWATEGFPADNDDPTDGATRNVPTSVPNGTSFGLSVTSPAWRLESTGPICSTMRSYYPAKLIWSSKRAKKLISRPEMSWYSAVPFTTGSIVALSRA